jgi:hypothetical protein
MILPKEAWWKGAHVWKADRIRSRLRVSAEADPELVRFGAGTHRYLLCAALSEAEVVAFEERHGVRLPEAYRSFLTEVGDGGAGPDYGLYRLDGADMSDLDRDERDTPGFLTRPFPHTAAWNPRSRLDEDAYWDPRWVAGSLIIAHFGCGVFHRLVVTGPARGQVWLDDRASDGGLSPQTDFQEWYLRWLDTSPG